MSSINPTPAYTRDPAEVTFRRALDHVRPAWIHDFLYPSPTAHLENLQYMLRQPRRVTAIRSISTIFSSDAPTLNESKRCLLLPSFTIGPLSLMYYVSEYVSSDVSPYKLPHICRCIQDDQHGVFFKFAELNTGLTEVNIMLRHSPGVREHVLLIVVTESFRDVMHALAKDGVYNQKLMHEALIYTMRIVQTRPCPVCGRNSDACKCLDLLVRKRYPIDFDRDLLNLTSYNVGYDGVCYQAIHEGGVNVSNWVSSVGVSAMFSFDDYHRQKLESWAMWHALQGRENILKTVMPDVVINTPRIEYAGESDHTVDDGVSAIAEAHDILLGGSSLHNIDGPPVVQIEQPIAGNTPANELLEQGSSDGPAVPRDYFSPTDAEPTLQVLPETHEDVRSTVCRDSGISSHGHVLATEVRTDAQLTHIPEQSQQSQQPPAVIPSTLPPGHQSQPEPTNREPSASLYKDGVTRRKRMGRPPSCKTRGVSRLLPIVPATKVTAADADITVNAIRDEDTSAVELRKTRNRESAARSDARKKKWVQGLEDNLKEAKRREDALREQIQELMEANVALRMRLQK